MSAGRYPRSVSVLTALLAAVAVAGAIGATAWPLPELSLAASAPLFVALALSGAMQLTFRFRDEVEALDLFEAVLTPIVFLVPGVGAVVFAAGAKLTSQIRLRVSPVKAAFNVAQWSAVAAVASVVYRSLGDGSFHGADVAWLALAMACGMVVNHLSVLLVITLAEQRPLSSSIRQLAPVMIPGWLLSGVVNIIFGLLFAALAATAPAATVIVLVPLAALGWASRSYAAARANALQLDALHRATHELAAVVDPLDECGSFLDTVRSCFAADEVEIVLLSGRRVIRSGATTGSDAASFAIAEVVAALGSSVRIVDDQGDNLRHLLHAKQRRSCLAAPLLTGGDVIGMLATYDRAGFESLQAGETSVLEALALEVSSALHRHELLRELVTERARYEDIVARSSDGIFSVTRDGLVDSWNPAMAEITGHQVADVLGTSIALLRASDTDGRRVAFERWAAGAALPASVKIATAENDERWLACSYSRSPDQDGALIVSARDVTAARELEQLKDDFVGVVSHELRTPLTSIRGFTDLLLDSRHPVPPERQRDALATIRRGVQRLDRLVVNLLEVSRITTGDGSVRLGVVDLEAICRRVVDDHHENAPTRTITITARQPVFAIGNETSVEQVAENLVANALKYAPKATIAVTIERDGDDAVLAVHDDGPGIPERDQERIFDRFERLEHTTSRAGTGLGLYIARQLSIAMGGELTVDSEEGRGTTFRLRLPLVVTPTDARPEPSRRLELVRDERTA